MSYAKRIPPLFSLLLLVLAANLWATFYVSSERCVYFWDYSLYWLKFGDLTELLRHGAGLAIRAVTQSIAFDDYNFIPVLPLAPIGLTFGAGRLPYVLGITNLSLLPAAFLLALLLERFAPERSWARVTVSTAAILGLHILWAPVLRGFPDVIGVAIAALALLIYFGRPLDEQRLIRLVEIGLLLCLLTLTRRWYVFWVAAFFPAAALLGLVEGGWRRVPSTIGRLAIVGTCLAVCLLVLAAPLVVRVALSNYGSEFSAYRADLRGGPMGQVMGHFGLALLGVCAGGLGWLCARPETRRLGLFLVVQAVIAVGAFIHVQGLMGPQHYYLLTPAAAVGVVAVIHGVWTRPSAVLRVAGVAGVLAIVLLSSVTVFRPAPTDTLGVLPRVRFAPMVRGDLAEVDRLLDALEGLKPKHVYVAASSEVMNWSILQVACRQTHAGLCPALGVTQDVDTRDGFPRGLLGADYLVLATPTQVHLRPEDQQTVGLVADQVRERRGIGATFEPLPGRYLLDGGVNVEIYRRTAPIAPEALRALSAALVIAHPEARRVLTYRE